MYPAKIPNYHLEVTAGETQADGSKTFAAYFHELPNCIGQGATAPAAEAAARRILPRFLERMQMAGVPLPAPLPDYRGTAGSGAELATDTGARTVALPGWGKGTPTMPIHQVNC